MSRGQIKVSVIMSAYNACNYIKQAVDSILAQTFQNFEFLITDDCSSDDTINILKSYTDGRIKIFYNTQRNGLTQNLNNMISHAKGEYIARIDADDIAYPTRLEKQVSFLEKKKDIFLVCSYAQAIGKKNNVIITPQNHESIVCSFLFGNPIVHSSVMFKNEGTLYNPSYLKAQDYELWSRLYHEGKKFAVIREPLVYLRFHNSQISSECKSEQKKYAVQVQLSELGYYSPKVEDDVLNYYKRYIEEGCLDSNEQIRSILKIFQTIQKSRVLKTRAARNAMKKELNKQHVCLYEKIKDNNLINKKEKYMVLHRAFSMFFVKRFIANMLI